MVRLFHRSFNRAMLPVKYSEGFNPHPKFSIANPLSLGIESEEEYVDIEMEIDIPVEEFIQRMNEALPDDIRILRGKYLEKKDSISSLLEWSFYELKFFLNNDLDFINLQDKLDQWLKNEEIKMKRMKKKGKTKIEVEVNIRPLIGNIVVKGRDEYDFIVINALLKTGEVGNLKPLDFIETIKRDLEIDIDIESIMIKRIAQYAVENGKIYSPI